MTEPRFSRLHTSLQQGFTLSPNAILKEAWQRIHGAKLPIILATLGVVGVWLVLNQLLVTISGDEEELSWEVNLLGLVISMLMAPMTAALDMIGVHRAADKTVRPNQIFDYFKFIVPLAITSMIMGLLTSLFIPLSLSVGLSPLVGMIPTMLMSIALMFTFPLIIDKGFTPLQAITTSLRLFSRQWVALFSIHIMLVLVFVVAILSFGIGFIWAIPLYMVTKGIIYRQACGIDSLDMTNSNQDPTATPPSKDHFDA